MFGMPTPAADPGTLNGFSAIAVGSTFSTAICSTGDTITVGVNWGLEATYYIANPLEKRGSKAKKLIREENAAQNA